MENYYNSKFTVSELIEELKKYNPDAYVVGVYDDMGYGVESIGCGGGDGCTKENCDDVTIHFGNNNSSENEMFEGMEILGRDVPFSTLHGKVINKIEGMYAGSDEIIFHCEDGSVFRMFHYQDCCESVTVDDVYGDVDDIIGSEILLAEENSSSSGKPKDEFDNSFTWTFYKLATIKGYVDIRWYGTSNGYYSEKVDFTQIKP